MGPEVCPCFCAAMGAIRVETWRCKCALAGGTARQFSDGRDVMGQLKQKWGWEDTENDMIRVADGPLCLLYEGRSVVRQVAVMAWA